MQGGYSWLAQATELYPGFIQEASSELALKVPTLGLMLNVELVPQERRPGASRRK